MMLPFVAASQGASCGHYGPNSVEIHRGYIIFVMSFTANPRFSITVVASGIVIHTIIFIVIIVTLSSRLLLLLPYYLLFPLVSCKWLFISKRFAEDIFHVQARKTLQLIQPLVETIELQAKNLCSVEPPVRGSFWSYRPYIFPYT